jgi:hypothetical protein
VAFHQREYGRLRAELQATHDASQLLELCLHKEFAGACVKMGSAKGRPRRGSDAFPN